MVEIVKQTIDFFLKFRKKPELKDLKIKSTDYNLLLSKRGNIFVTIYLNSEINGSSGNIKEIQDNIVDELIDNTINAINEDPRFEKLKIDDIPNIKIRVDEIVNRNILQTGEIKTLEPMQNGVIAIKKDYETLVVILPNISASILSGEDLLYYLQKKLGIKEFKEEDYIIYSIETEVYKDF